MQQTTIFDFIATANQVYLGRNYPHPPYQRHSATSRAAANAITDRVTPLQQRVLAYIKNCGGATDGEIAAGLNMNPSTARPRRIELVTAGRVVDSGLRRASAGSHIGSTVWKVAP